MVDPQYGNEFEGKTRRDRNRSVAIKSNLEVKMVETTIEENKLRFFGHLRMNMERAARITYEIRVEGIRPRGQPRIDHLGGGKWDRKRTLSKLYRIEGITSLPSNREEW